MAEDTMLGEAIKAARQGDYVRAKDLLTRLLRGDQNNIQYWYWMSSVVDTQKEKIFCLQNILRIDPENQVARRGLILLGAMPADDSITPIPPKERKWEIAKTEETASGFFGKPIVRFAVFGVVNCRKPLD